MTPRDLFGLAIRIIGLIVSIYGLDWLARFTFFQLGYFKLEHTDIGYYLLSAFAYLIAGAYFLRGAPHFVRYAYGDASDGAPATEVRSE